jgi:hypothetical protein
MNYVRDEAECILRRAMAVKGETYCQDYKNALEYVVQVLKDAYQAGKRSALNENK